MPEEKKSFWTKQVHRNGESKTVANIASIVKVAVIVVVALIVAVMAWPARIVGATERGIRYTFGKPETEVLQPGIHFYTPFIGNIKTWSIEPVKTMVNIDIDQSGAISKDNQIIGTRLVVYYKYDESRIYDIATNYQSKTTIENPLASNVNSIMKAIIGTYTIFDLAANQEIIGTNLQTRLAAAIQRYPIEITQVNVSNFDWSSDFDKQINATMEAAQRVRQAEQQANIAEQENRKLTIEATAQAAALEAKATGELRAAELRAQAAVATAQGERDAQIARGEGVRQYNQSVATNLATEIRLRELEIELEKAKRWDGRQVPTYVPLSPNGGIVTLPPAGR